MVMENMKESSTEEPTGYWINIVDTWCQNLPSCGASPSSPWFLSSSSLPKKKKHDADSDDNDTVATASTTQASEDTSSERAKTVSFGSLQVREYERLVDNHIYMGLSLGWDCTDHSPQPIPVQEGRKISNSSGGGETLHVRKKHNGERFAIFLAYGFTRKELKQEANKAAKFFRQRQLELIRKEEEQMALEATMKRAAKNKSMGDPTKRRALLFSMFRH